MISSELSIGEWVGAFEKRIEHTMLWLDDS